MRWVVRHYESGLILHVLRSGFYVYVNGIKLENWRDKVIFLHDKATRHSLSSTRLKRLEQEAYRTIIQSLKLASVDSTWSSTR
ncbi:hypothetical protein [Sulfolobus sp. B1]|uniref:hypothetical protein n=1 Tax=Sulfolobus sp. B1 TaxID=2200888 RepID=UPI00117DA957|nr:hypothetical protein [Sulfolobus sp. B1]